MKYKLTALTIVAIIFFAFFSTVSYAAEAVHKIDELNMEITTPDGLAVITRDTKATDSAFSQSGLDYEAVMQILEKDNVYLYSQTADGSCKITVSMVENEESKSYYNFTSLSKARQDEIINAFTSQPECNSCYTYELENGQAFFFCPSSRYKNADGSELNVAQYITIVNGQRIIIQLAVSGGTYTNEQTVILKNMVDSIRFTAINKKGLDFVSLLPYVYVVIGVLTIVIIVMLVILFKRKRQDRNKRIAEETEFEDFLENTSVFSAEDNNQDEPEEPLVIIADASAFNGDYNGEKALAKDKEDTETQNKSESEEKPDLSSETDENNTVSEKTSGNESETEAQLDLPSTDDTDSAKTDDFVVAEGSASNEKVFNPKNNNSEAFANIKPSTDSEDFGENFVESGAPGFSVPERRSLSDKNSERRHSRTQTAKRKKGSENVFVKVGMGILNVFIGIGFLISYLISMVISPKKNKSSADRVHNSKKKSSYRRR